MVMLILEQKSAADAALLVCNCPEGVCLDGDSLGVDRLAQGGE